MQELRDIVLENGRACEPIRREMEFLLMRGTLSAFDIAVDEEQEDRIRRFLAAYPVGSREGEVPYCLAPVEAADTLAAREDSIRYEIALDRMLAETLTPSQHEAFVSRVPHDFDSIDSPRIKMRNARGDSLTLASGLMEFGIPPQMNPMVVTLCLKYVVAHQASNSEFAHASFDRRRQIQLEVVEAARRLRDEVEPFVPQEKVRWLKKLWRPYELN